MSLPNAWRTIRAVALSSGVALSACVERPPDFRDAIIDPSPFWTARLEARANNAPTAPLHDRTAITGEAMMLPGPKTGETMVQLAIVNAVPSQWHSWHIHHGACESGGNVAGPSSEYPPLVSNASGKAGVRALLPFTVPAIGQFHVDIHASLTSADVIACGDLRRTY